MSAARRYTGTTSVVKIEEGWAARVMKVIDENGVAAFHLTYVEGNTAAAIAHVKGMNARLAARSKKES